MPEQKTYRQLPPRATDAAAVALAAARRLCEHYRADLALGERPWPELHGSRSGPCQPDVEHRTKGVGVHLESEQRYAENLAWHTYCREHGYRCADDDPAAPPRPSTPREEAVWFSWALLGRMHREDLAARERPSLFDDPTEEVTAA